MKKIRPFIYILIPFAIVVATTFIRYNSLRYDFWISYVVFFTALLLLFSKYDYDKRKILLSFIFTLVALHGFAWVLEGPPTPGLMNILGEFMACFLSYLFYINRSIFVRVGIIFFSITLCVFHFFWGYFFWENYATYGHAVENHIEPLPTFWQTYIQDPLTGMQYLSRPDAVIVLDFFSTGCGVCFEKFPLLQDLHEKYSGNPKVFVCAMNIPWKRDTAGMAVNMVRKRNFTFPVVIGRNKLDSIFQIAYYPTVIVVKNNQILYRGSIENVSPTIETAIGN